jgi:hypothetical protein
LFGKHGVVLNMSVCVSARTQARTHAGMYMPSLLGNFIYRDPLAVLRQQGGWRRLVRVLSLHLIAREVHMAATFCRQ